MDSIDRDNEPCTAENGARTPGETEAVGRRGLGTAVLLVALTLVGAVAARSGLPNWPGGESGEGASRGGSGPPPTVRLGGGASAPLSLEAQLDRGSVLAGGDGTLRMEVLIRGDESPTAGLPRRVATDLVVVLDRSGSMSGPPLAHAKAAIRQLVAELRDEDRFALVTYASDAAYALPMRSATNDARAYWLARLDAIEARGGTNMSLGLDLATELVAAERSVGRAARVILLSDGHANEGDRSLQGLRARARRAVAGEYVLSSVGIGPGFDEALMSTLADAGTGNFYYLRDGSELGRVFAGEFASARDTVASALAVVIEPGPGVEVLDAAGYPLEREGHRLLFRPGSLFAGQERRIWVTMRAPTRRSGELALGRLSLRFSKEGEPGALPEVQLPRIACVESEEDFFASVRPEVFERALSSEGIGVLKRRVATAVEQGDRQAAEREIEDFRRENRSYYSAFGRHAEESGAYAAADELLERVADAFAAAGGVAAAGRLPAAAPPPARRNALGKALLSESVDERREGAKRAP